MSELLKPATALHAFVNQLSAAEVRSMLYGGIYQKGRNYYQDGMVGEVEITREGRIEAEVSGTDDYTVELFEKNGGVYGKCSCPYSREWDGPCKHIAAVLLHLCDEPPEGDWPTQTNITEKSTGRPDDAFEKFLVEQSQDQLRQLVRQLATPEFRAEIALRHSSPDAKAQTFFDVRAKIARLLNKDWECKTVDDIDPKIGEQLRRLRGAWDFNPEDIAQLFEEIMADMDNIMDKGGLSGEYGEDIGEPEEILEALFDFLRALPSPVRVRMLPGIWAAASATEYDIFSDLWEAMPSYIALDDVPALGKAIAQNMPMLSSGQQVAFFQQISPAMGEAEQLQFLENQVKKGGWHFAGLYGQAAERADKAARAFATLCDLAMAIDVKEYASTTHFIPLFEEALRLAQLVAVSVAPICQKFIQAVPQESTLLRVAALDPSNLSKYEAILERRSVPQFLKYLENQGRLPEVVARLEKAKPKEDELLRPVGSNEAAQFYARHAAQFPNEARRCFSRILAANLPYPSSSNYDNVVEALQLLRPLLADPDFRAQVADIRANYSRRRLLMEKLDARFGKK